MLGHMLSAIPSIIHIGILVFVMPGLLPGPDALTAVSEKIRRILLIRNNKLLFQEHDA